MPRAESDSTARALERAVLAAHRPPDPTDDGEGADKFARGQVVVVGGDADTAGSVLLAALAALRAGAGRAHVVTDPAAAIPMAVANPELRVSALPDPVAVARSPELVESLRTADAVVIGTGCRDRMKASRLAEQLLPLVAPTATVCLDAGALPFVADRPSVVADCDARTILLPNFGETAELLGVALETVEQDPGAAARDAVDRFRTTVAVRGTTTWVSAPGADLFVERGGHAALGTSGSGDVLVGLVAALAARGTEPLGAVLWGVHVHARCGETLAAQHGGIGLLARELLVEVPRQLNDLMHADAVITRSLDREVSRQ